MPPAVKCGLRWTLTLIFGAASFAFGAGKWTQGIERRQDAQADSIYVCAQKYTELENRCVELQAVYWTQNSRIDRLEEMFTRSGDILEALYEHETGQEWSGE
jgi:hypothetical protein